MFRSDGTTPVGPGVAVTFDACWPITSGCQIETTTDSSGGYQFRYLPLRAFTLRVLDPGTRALGYASGTLTTSGETRTLNITLLAQGTLVVTVVGETGTALPGAAVSVIASAANVQDRMSGTTGADGTIIFQHLLAANFNAQASLGGVTGSVQGTLAGGEVKPITISLEPSASLAGHVYEPDGVTPVPAGMIAIRQNERPYYSAQLTLTDGTFRFDQVKVGTYTLQVYDAASSPRLRALARGVLVGPAGQVVTRDITMAGLGTVVGRVFNPDGSPAPGVEVNVRSLAPEIGNGGACVTDEFGDYAVREIIVGAVVAKAEVAVASYLLGEATGVLANHGGTAVLDIRLANNAVNMPQQLYDANGVDYDVQGTGALDRGTYQAVFYGDGATQRYGMLLELVAGDAVSSFAGGSIGRVEDQGREISVRQDALAGLNVVQ